VPHKLHTIRYRAWHVKRWWTHFLCTQIEQLEGLGNN